MLKKPLNFKKMQKNTSAHKIQVEDGFTENLSFKSKLEIQTQIQKLNLNFKL